MTNRIQITNSIAGQLLAGVPLHLLRDSKNELAQYDAEELLTAMAEQIITLRSELYISACQQGDLRGELEERRGEQKELTERHNNLLKLHESLERRLTEIEAKTFKVDHKLVFVSPEKGLTVGIYPHVDINKEVFERIASTYPKWLSVNPADYYIRRDHTFNNTIADKAIERFNGALGEVSKAVSTKS